MSFEWSYTGGDYAILVHTVTLTQLVSSLRPSENATGNTSTLLKVIEDLNWLINCSDTEMMDGATARIKAKEFVITLTALVK